MAMYDGWDKIKIWKQVLERLAEEVDMGTYSTVQQHAYLDSLERREALIGCKSVTWLETFERKRLFLKLEPIFAEVCQVPIIVKFVQGRPRIIEKRKPTKAEKAYNQALQARAWGEKPEVDASPMAFGINAEHPLTLGLPRLKPADKTEYAALHAQYGDIIGIVDNHPVFVMAQKPIINGGWGIFKRVLTRRCKDYGVEAVLTGLREVASMPKVDRPRAYFLSELKRGRWGHKLTVTPSLTGPQLAPV